VTSRIGGQTIIGCVREETDDEFQRAEHLARGGLTNIQVPPISEILKRKTFSSVLDCVSRNLDLL
jgi:hypothetical protein